MGKFNWLPPSVDLAAMDFDEVNCSNCGYNKVVNEGVTECPVCHEETLSLKGSASFLPEFIKHPLETISGPYIECSGCNKKSP